MQQLKINSPATVVEGESYTVRLTVTNQSTKAGIPVEAMLEIVIAAATTFTTLIPVTATMEAFGAGQTRTFDYPMSVPFGSGGESGQIIGLVRDPAGVELVRATEGINIEPTIISFTVTLINCPIHPTYAYATDRYFTDGTGARVPCGQAGSWTVETTPFNFSIAVYTFWPMGIPPYYGWHYVKTYSFSATVENGKNYIYDCATGEFADITEVRRIRAYWKGNLTYLNLRENGLTFNGKRAIDPMGYNLRADLPYALKSTFIIPINATITRIEFKLLGVYGYYVRFDYKWTDQKPGEAEVTIAQGSKSPPYVADPYKAYTHYIIPI